MSTTLRSNTLWSSGSRGSSSTIERSPGALRAKAHDRSGSTSVDVACRLLNVFVALIGIVVTAPLMLIVAVLVRLDSKGPAIYRQERVGLCRRGSRGRNPRERRRAQNMGGRVFTIYKFRTMTVAQSGEERWATRDDVRITRLGRVLRATRIDELPQLFNVLRGEMSLVGPRPHAIEIGRAHV